MIGLEVQIRGEAVARRRDGARGLVARRFQPIEQVAAALAQLLDHIVADLAELQRDVLAFFGQRMSDALRGFVDLLADEIADRGQILRQIDLDVIDRGAYLLGLADQRVALVGEILEQAANPDFVVAIGAFERRDLVLHQRFELAGARQRALDAVAHGRDFAADRLADGHDRIPRHAFGLGEPHGDPAIDCAIRRNSCARHAMWATPKKKMTGNSAAAPRPIIRAAGEWSGPSAALRLDR